MSVVFVVFEMYLSTKINLKCRTNGMKKCCNISHIAILYLCVCVRVGFKQKQHKTYTFGRWRGVSRESPHLHGNKSCGD